MYDSGVKFYNRYESLARLNVPFIRSSSSARVVASSEQFIAGFQATKKIDKHASHTQVAPVINVILEETSAFNNSLDPDTCTNFENSEVGDDAQATFANIFVPAILKRVQENLPGVTLNINEVTYLMDLCSFDTVAKTTDASQLSPFCNLFSHKEWVQYNYYQSLGKYYGYGGGNPLGPAQGIGFTNELIARLTHTPVNDHTSTNTTLDSGPSTFPLNATLYANFSHDNGLTPIFFAMGLYNGTKPLSQKIVESIEETDGYSAAWSVPFSARAYVEMMICKGSKEPLVRVLVNDRVAPLHGCNADHLGRCTRERFVGALEFARDGGNWGSCFN